MISLGIGKEAFECVDAPDIHCFSASVFFDPANGHHYHNVFLAPQPEEPDIELDKAEISYNQTSHCGHCHSINKTVRNKLPENTRINQLWWSPADSEYKSELVSLCGPQASRILSV